MYSCRIAKRVSGFAIVSIAISNSGLERLRVKTSTIDMTKDLNEEFIDAKERKHDLNLHFSLIHLGTS